MFDDKSFSFSSFDLVSITNGIYLIAGVTFVKPANDPENALFIFFTCVLTD
jgi:hypothetical protein